MAGDLRESAEILPGFNIKNTFLCKLWWEVEFNCTCRCFKNRSSIKAASAPKAMFTFITSPVASRSPIRHQSYTGNDFDNEEFCWRSSQGSSVSLAHLWKGALLWPLGGTKIWPRDSRGKDWQAVTRSRKVKLLLDCFYRLQKAIHRLLILGKRGQQRKEIIAFKIRCENRLADIDR